MSCYTPGERVVAPSLQYVGLRNISPPHHTRLINDGPMLPWEQLKHLMLGADVGIADLCDVLPQCISLRQLEVDWVVDADGVSESSLFNLPHLEDLRISFNNPTTFYRFFMFNTPNLITLIISQPPDVPDLINRFTVFMRRLRWTLQLIEITRTYGPESNDTTTLTEDIMRAVPFVLRFSAKAIKIRTATLSKIGTGHLLTNIEELHFRSYGNPWESVESLVAPSPYKVFHGSRLRDIYIYTDIPPHPLSQRIKELRSRGINIYLTPPAL
ncbi:hypothetical protein BDZ94DRAFT_1313943 [Collybia nuda]|uniref:F-box domain-containing protein n=1 Tax=Collybia nuda TaxID=64659 RepID=A0A9P6C9Z1_9AGAR|nr:hypothetical protein BDZ94DRAFT_1313943 [Collybia nuda]